MPLDMKGTKTQTQEVNVTDPIIASLTVQFGFGDRPGSISIAQVSFSDPSIQVPELRIVDDPSDPDPDYRKAGTQAGWALLNAVFAAKDADGNEHPETAQLEKTFGSVIDQHILVAGEAILVALLERKAKRDAEAKLTDLEAVLDRLTAQRAANSEADAALDTQIAETQAQIKALQDTSSSAPSSAAPAGAVAPNP